MKKKFATAAFVTLLSAHAASSQSFTDRVVSTLKEEGFQTLEVKNGPTETKVEAVRGSTKLEVVYDRATGAIVEQEVERFVGTLNDNRPIEVKTEDHDFSDAARGRDDEDEDDEDDDDDDRDEDERDDDDDRDDEDDRDDDDDDDRDEDHDDDSDDGDDDGDDGDDDGDDSDDD